MKPIWELEKSEAILDRQKYAERIKIEFLPKIESRLKKLNEQWQQAKAETKPENIPQESWDIYLKSKIKGIEYEYNLEKRLLKNLKIRLSSYDIYNQKMSCQVCHEVECVCYTIDKSFEQEINKLF